MEKFPLDAYFSGRLKAYVFRRVCISVHRPLYLGKFKPSGPGEVDHGRVVGRRLYRRDLQGRVYVAVVNNVRKPIYRRALVSRICYVFFQVSVRSLYRGLCGNLGFR